MTTYGEIVEPTSRAAWEDWDDVSPVNNNARLEWQAEIKVPELIESLIILEGKYLHDCIKNQTEHSFKLLNAIKAIDISLYNLDQSNMYIVVVRDYNILQSSEIVELIKPFLIVSRNVIAIQTKPLIEYQSLEPINRNCVMRVICTTEPAKSGNVFPKLEQPNFVSGIAAGAICLREHLKLCGKAIICYMEHPEEYQIEEVQNLLQELKVITNINLKPKTVLNSNLYI